MKASTLALCSSIEVKLPRRMSFLARFENQDFDLAELGSMFGGEVEGDDLCLSVSPLAQERLF